MYTYVRTYVLPGELKNRREDGQVENGKGRKM